MDQQALKILLNELITHWENELIEFKNADSSYKADEIGKYFSALANEANLRNFEKAWLVFGVDNKSRKIVGTDYRQNKEQLQNLKFEISRDSEPSITFREIHILESEQGRVLLFEIPAAPLGMPIAWKGHYYGRAGESLKALGLVKLETIRAQVGTSDWTAQIVKNAVLAHLDEIAIQKSREAYTRKYANRFDAKEIENWSDSDFLDRAKVTIGGQITRAALLLLGKDESAHLLSPHPVQMTWKLDGPERAYQHFGPPFLLNSTNLYQKIRNIQLRILPENELLAIEVAKYDQKIVLEALHNCIAHQDYNRNGRIIVTEQSDKLIFESEGAFFDGLPDDYILGNKTPKRYRNPFLAQAMSELNMIDTMGYGIHQMYTGQARRYFPMPDYDLRESGAVKMVIHGGIVDPAYSKMLIQKTDLSFDEIFALDRIQKHFPLDAAMVKHLRHSRLIEGRKPNFHISASIAAVTATQADYIRTRAQDNTFYTKLIHDYLTQFGSATRQEINKLLWDKISDALNSRQKHNKIGNLVGGMRKAQVIKNTGARKSPRWVLNQG